MFNFGSIKNFETTLIHKDGTKVPILLSAVLLRDEGKVIGSVGFFKDSRPLRDVQVYKRKSQQFWALFEASKAIAGGFAADQKELLDNIVEQAVKGIIGDQEPKVSLGVIQLYNETTHELSFASVYPREELPRLTARLGDRRSIDRSHSHGKVGITGRVILDKQPQLIGDVSVDPDYLEFRARSKSELDVPLREDDRFLGVLSLESDQKNAFDPEDLNTLEALAELAVIAIKTARQAEQLRRTNAIALMGAWGAEIAHDINRSVGRIRLIVSLLLCRSDLPKEMEEELRKIDQEADRLGLPALPRKPAKPGEPLELKYTAPVDDIAKGVVEVAKREPSLNPQLIPIESNLACPGLHVALHPYLMRSLITHLVLNALRSVSESGRLGRVTIRTSQNKQEVEISVQDTGTGIPSEIACRLFSEPIPHHDGSQGIGLLLVRSIAELHGGSAYLIDNQLGNGASFGLRVPLAPLPQHRRL